VGERQQAASEGPLETLSRAKRMWEILLWLIEVGIAVVGFVNSVGGPIQFLIEVAFFGFACYASLFVVAPAAAFAFQWLEGAFHRQTTDPAMALTIAAGVLGVGALIRFGLFAPGVTRDLDVIGSVFAATVGVAIMSIPLIALWYFRGSRPANL
jgi:hypothetical protein